MMICAVLAVSARSVSRAVEIAGRVSDQPDKGSARAHPTRKTVRRKKDPIPVGGRQLKSCATSTQASGEGRSEEIARWIQQQTNGPWAVAVDGNDNIWISNFAMPDSPIVQLCGVKTENCAPGMKTGDQISPPGGYVGGGLQMQTDIAVDPAGNVWAMNNWQDIDSCFGYKNEALSTRCGGQGVTIFYGMAKPVRAPQIGPARPY